MVVNEQIITNACKTLMKGGLLIFPTDTVYGIGCLLNQESAIKRLFDIKRRAQTKAVPVLVGAISMAEQYFDHPNDIATKFMHQYWPGGLTIVSRCYADLVPQLVRGGSDTIGLRMPNYELILEIIKRTKIPLLGPSANFSGDVTPTAFNLINPDLIKLVDGVINLPCGGNLASTVVDCTTENYQILRTGLVTIK
jgi:L-threonylcarbamoyladenylate synthase